MNVSSHKCQLSIKREEKVFPSKVMKGTPSQTEHKGNSNAAAQWTVFSKCPSFLRLFHQFLCQDQGCAGRKFWNHLFNDPIIEVRDRGTVPWKMVTGMQQVQPFTYWLLYQWAHCLMDCENPSLSKAEVGKLFCKRSNHKLFRLAGHRISVATTQLCCCCNRKAAINNEYGCFDKMYIQK